MSGEAGGLILVPLALAALPVVGMVLVGGAVIAGASAGVNAAASAAEKRAEERRRQQEMIRRSGITSSVNSFRNTINNNIAEQTRLNNEISNQMMREIEKNRQQVMSIIQSNDPEKYQQYMGQIRTSRQQLSNTLFEIQEGFVRDYQVKITQSMDNVSNTINSQFASYINELQQMQADLQAKNERASQIANDYIAEAKDMIQTLESEFNAKKFSLSQLIEIQKLLNDAVAQYNMGNYEAAIATAKDATLETIEEIYKTDCKKQEWDNFYSMALSISSELYAYMQAQAVITADVKKEVEAKVGKKLEDEIVGIKISEYTDKMKDGQSQYDYLLGKVYEIKTFLESDQASQVSTQQLKEYVDLLNCKLYPSATLSIYKGILNMSNAFSRQNISEEIIDFFEDHNFNFTGYSYDDERHDGTLHIGLENDVTGEEIIVTLAPEVMENGEVQTKVEINQLKGDETNEERKAFYRESVQNVVAESTPGAQIKLECKTESKNKLSQKTELRDRLKI